MQWLRHILFEQKRTTFMYTKTDYDITVVVNFDGGVRTVHQDSQFFSQGV